MNARKILAKCFLPDHNVTLVFEEGPDGFAITAIDKDNQVINSIYLSPPHDLDDVSAQQITKCFFDNEQERMIYYAGVENFLKECIDIANQNIVDPNYLVTDDQLREFFISIHPTNYEERINKLHKYEQTNLIEIEQFLQKNKKEGYRPRLIEERQSDSQEDKIIDLDKIADNSTLNKSPGSEFMATESKSEDNTFITELRIIKSKMQRDGDANLTGAISAIQTYLGKYSTHRNTNTDELVNAAKVLDQSQPLVRDLLNLLKIPYKIDEKEMLEQKTPIPKTSIEKIIDKAIEKYKNTKKPLEKHKLTFWETLQKNVTNGDLTEKTLNDTLNNYPRAEKGTFSHYTADHVKEIRARLRASKK